VFYLLFYSTELNKGSLNSSLCTKISFKLQKYQQQHSDFKCSISLWVSFAKQRKRNSFEKILLTYLTIIMQNALAVDMKALSY